MYHSNRFRWAGYSSFQELLAVSFSLSPGCYGEDIDDKRVNEIKQSNMQLRCGWDHCDFRFQTYWVVEKNKLRRQWRRQRYSCLSLS